MSICNTVWGFALSLEVKKYADLSMVRDPAERLGPAAGH
jgi:hypothetical protein